MTKKNYTRNVPAYVNTTAAWIAKALSVLHALTLSAIAMLARSITWLSLAAQRASVALIATWRSSKSIEDVQPPKDYAQRPRVLSLKELALMLGKKHD